MLISDGDTVTLNAESVEVDAARFEALLAEDTVDARARAIDLYGGELLAGLGLNEPGFQDWIQVERTRLGELARRVLRRQLNDQIKAGDITAAIDTAQRLLAFDALQENVQRDLMRLYAADGQIGLALNQYELCRGVLAEELGIEPDAETVRVIDAIRQARRQGRAYELTPAEAPPPADPVASPPATSGKPSIAVLPFDNMSGDSEQDYFADGVTEDIIASLVRRRWLTVVSRNSSFAHRGGGADLRRVSRELEVRYILEGSVRRGGERIRITAQLIDAAEDRHVWAERYDRMFEDIFELQDEITGRIVTALGPEITLAETERAKRERPHSLDAWDHYLQALPHVHQITRESSELAKTHLRQACALDPGFSAARTGLAWCLVLEAIHGWRSPGQPLLDEAVEQADAAVARDSDDPLAHCAQAVARAWTGQQHAAIEAAQRAIELDPNLPDANGCLGFALALDGQGDSAIGYLQRALNGSPRDPLRWAWCHGMTNAHFAAERYAEAIDWARKTIQIRPGWSFSHALIAASAAWLERPGEAAAALDALRARVPNHSLGRIRRNPIWTRQQDVERLIEGLRRAGLPE